MWPFPEKRQARTERNARVCVAPQLQPRSGLESRFSMVGTPPLIRSDPRRCFQHHERPRAHRQRPRPHSGQQAQATEAFTKYLAESEGLSHCAVPWCTGGTAVSRTAERGGAHEFGDQIPRREEGVSAKLAQIQAIGARRLEMSTVAIVQTDGGGFITISSTIRTCSVPKNAQ